MAIIIGPVTDPGPMEVGKSATVSVGGETDYEWYGVSELKWSGTGLPPGFHIPTVAPDEVMTSAYDGWPPVTVTGIPTVVGTGTATITASDGNPDSESIEWEWEVIAAVPDPDPEAAPPLAEQLAPKVLIFAGRKSTPEALTLAIAQTEVVADFVHGYTRGQGWYVNDPVPALRSVIVSAAARLVNNPGQLTYYGIADYNERPAVLNGYTLTELGVLHNYRRRQA